MSNLISRLAKEPYPFNYELKKLAWLLPVIFIVGTLFLYIFQPFNNNWEEHNYPFWVICMMHSLVAVLILSPFFILADYFISDKNNWTILKEFFLMLFAFLAIGVGNYLIRDLIYSNENDNWNISYLLEEIKHAFAIGLVIYPVFIWINHLRLKSKYQSKGKNLSKYIASQSTVQSVKEITFLNAAGQPELQLPEQQVLFIKSEGNYIQVFYRKEKIEKRLIRSTLSFVAQSYPDFFHPHRSYLVNLDAVSNIGGNSQGYTLHFDDCDISIPVSRNKKEELISLQKRLN